MNLAPLNKLKTSGLTFLLNFSFMNLIFFLLFSLIHHPAYSVVAAGDLESDCKALINAIEQQDYIRISELLSSIDPDCTVLNPDRKISKGKNKGQLFFQSARSPLVAAARNGDLEAGMMLIEAGADVVLSAQSDESSLIAASASGNLELVKLLVRNGAKVNKVVPENGTALIAASRAGNSEIVKFLLSEGAEVNQVTSTDGTALVNAIRSGHYEVSRILLEHGADPFLSTPGDEDPAFHARKQKDKRFLKLLKGQHQKIPTNKDTQVKGASAEIDDLIIWLRNIIEDTMEANNIPALSIGIIREGQIYYSDGFGNLERGNGKEVTDKSLYQIGSSTKQFTGIIIRNLIAEGKLDLKGSLITYIPENALTAEAKEKLKDITVKDMLLHRSGLPNRAPGNKRIDGDPMLIPYNEYDLIKDLNQITLDFQPDTEGAYSNFGYAVLGFVAELASGNAYSALVEKYIAKKYNLENTFIHPNWEQLSSIVTPYRKDDRDIKSAPWRMGKIAPAGGVYSNIHDLSKLMIQQIHAYREFSRTGKADNPLILTDQYEEEGSHYGFGLAKNVDEVTGIRYGHGGDLDGYASSYVFSPEKGKGFILLTSSGGSWIGDLEKEIRDRMKF